MLFVNNEYESLDKILDDDMINEASKKSLSSNKQIYDFFDNAGVRDITDHLFDEASGLKPPADPKFLLKLSDNSTLYAINGTPFTFEYLNDILVKYNITLSKVDGKQWLIAQLNDTSIIFKYTSSGKKIKSTDNAGRKEDKGKQFEHALAANINDYLPKLQKIAKDNGMPFTEIVEVEEMGDLNQKRKISLYSILNGTVNLNIGSKVTDVTVKTDNDDMLYLSAKSTNTVTFLNAGITKYITKDFFDTGKISEDGRKFLSLLGITSNELISQFRNVFLDYKGVQNKKDVTKTRIPVTDYIKNSKAFKNLIRAAVGYGYILVHQHGSNVTFRDMIKQDKMESYIGDVQSAILEFPTGGTAKRVDLVVHYDKIKFVLNIRNKAPNTSLPTHLMVDYKFM